MRTMDYEQVCGELTAQGFEVGGSEVSLGGKVEGWLLFGSGGAKGGQVDKISAKPGSRFEQTTSAWAIDRHPWGTPTFQECYENFQCD